MHRSNRPATRTILKYVIVPKEEELFLNAIFTFSKSHAALSRTPNPVCDSGFCAGE